MEHPIPIRKAWVDDDGNVMGGVDIDGSILDLISGPQTPWVPEVSMESVTRALEAITTTIVVNDQEKADSVHTLLDSLTGVFPVKVVVNEFAPKDKIYVLPPVPAFPGTSWSPSVIDGL